MARKTEDAAITTRKDRSGLAPRPGNPYWRSLGRGEALGYRKPETGGGVWVARLQNDKGNYRKAVIGAADDAEPCATPGLTVMDFGKASRAAHAWGEQQRKVDSGEAASVAKAAAKPLTVADVIEGYFAAYARGRTRGGGKGADHAMMAAKAHILPKLGTTPVAKLTNAKITAWHDALADAPPRVRSAKGKTKAREVDMDDEDVKRRRRASANRVLTILKAALNYAKAKMDYPGEDTWRHVKPFGKVDAPKIDYLNPDEITRFCNACPADFRQLVTGALLTGARYGELAAMRVDAFDPNASMIHIPRSKSGKARHIALNDEGVAFFERLTAGQPGKAHMFTHLVMTKQATRDAAAVFERAPWGKSQQARLMAAACRDARLGRLISFHILRHTHASLMVQRGAELTVIAEQLGHADTRVTHRNYAHLGPSYVKDRVRATLPNMGIGAALADNVTPLRPAAKASGA